MLEWVCVSDFDLALIPLHITWMIFCSWEGQCLRNAPICWRPSKAFATIKEACLPQVLLWGPTLIRLGPLLDLLWHYPNREVAHYLADSFEKGFHIPAPLPHRHAPSSRKD